MVARRELIACVLVLCCVARHGEAWPDLGEWTSQWLGSPASLSPETEGALSELIVVFHDVGSVAKLNVMCNPSKLSFLMLAPAFGLNKNCHLPDMCRHIFRNTVYGFSGKVSDSDLEKVKTCIPNAVYYKEQNQVVHKAEDDGFWHVVDPVDVQGSLSRRRGSSLGRRLIGTEEKAGVTPIPEMRAYEESVKTSGSEGPPIEPSKVTGGVSMFSAGTKSESTKPLLWNLDRMDQRPLPLDGVYHYGTASTRGTGNGTTIYIVDSGIKKDHQEFQRWDGSGTRARYGYDFVDGDDDCDDCDGHGTHVAGTAVGLSVGAAKDAEVVSVRILDCDGSGSISNTVAALDWVAENHKAPAIVTLSLGIQVGSWSRVLEDAVSALINQHGITVIVAAGNSAVDACYVAPANVKDAITVAASNLADRYTGANADSSAQPDSVYKWTNSGPCVKVFAPGVDIYSACGGPSRCSTVDDRSYTYASGTSMAVPHVAGVAAIYLESYPQSSPSEVAAAILDGATDHSVNTTGLTANTPSKLLYSRLLGGESGSVQAASGP